MTSAHDPSQLARVGQRLASNDEGVSEVVSYSLMFALGAIALVFSMDVLVDAQEQGSRIAAAQQLNAVGQATATGITDATRAAETSPNASFESTINFPERIQAQNFTIRLTVPDEPAYGSAACDTGSEWRCFWHPGQAHDNQDEAGCPSRPTLHVSTGDNRLDAEIPLDNRTVSQATSDACLILDTQNVISSSAGGITIEYDRMEIHGHDRLPVITMRPPHR